MSPKAMTAVIQYINTASQIFELRKSLATIDSISLEEIEEYSLFQDEQQCHAQGEW
jgi:hypothetical protein